MRPSRWLSAILIVGVAYFAVGMIFGALGRGASSDHTRAVWRLLAWAISAAAFAAHIGYEHFQLRSSSVSTALHASLAVALGAFGIAAAANIHSAGSASNHQSSLLRLALIAFPVLTAVPAFLVALVAAASLSRWRRGAAQ